MMFYAHLTLNSVLRETESPFLLSNPQRTVRINTFPQKHKSLIARRIKCLLHSIGISSHSQSLNNCLTTEQPKNALYAATTIQHTSYHVFLFTRMAAHSHLTLLKSYKDSSSSTIPQSSNSLVNT